LDDRNDDRYIQAKFNYGIKTDEAIFNDTQYLANLIFLREYETAYEFAEVHLNKLYGRLGEKEYIRIIKILEGVKTDYVVFCRWKTNARNSKSRYWKAANKLDAKVTRNLRVALLKVDREVRMFLKNKGISSVKETDEMRSIIEGKE